MRWAIMSSMAGNTKLEVWDFSTDEDVVRDGGDTCHLCGQAAGKEDEGGGVGEFGTPGGWRFSGRIERFSGGIMWLTRWIGRGRHIPGRLRWRVWVTSDQESGTGWPPH